MTDNLKQNNMFQHYEITPSEKKILDPPPKLWTSDFAEKYRVVVKSEKSGPWRNINNPPLVGIMNMSDRRDNFKNLKILVALKGVQTGVTEAAYNIEYKKMVYSSQNALHIMESERKSKRVFKQRFLVNLRASKKLREQLTNNPDDITNYGITTKNGFNLNIGWSGSAAAVSSDPCEHVTLDEIDKFKSILNIEEAKDRVTTFVRTGFIFLLSTPGDDDGPIISEFNLCDTACDYHVVCPDCGEIQIMTFNQFTWPHKNELLDKNEQILKLANQINREKSAMYLCKSCNSEWDDYTRNEAVRLGLDNYFFGWKMRENINLPISLGVHFPTFISPFKSLSDIVSRWLKANTSDPLSLQRLQKWRNNEAAESYDEAVYGETVNYEMLYNRRYDYAPLNAKWQIPMKACFITCSVDVQENRLETEVTAWGEGIESWGVEKRIFYGDPSIEYGLPDSPYNDLDDYLCDSQWIHETGLKLKIGIAGIDSGYLTEFVYKYVLQSNFANIHAIDGSHVRNKPLISTSDPRPNGKRLMDQYNIQLVVIGTESAKTTIYACLKKEKQGPGYMHFHTGYDVGHFRQLTSEHVVKKYSKGRLVTTWEKKKEADPNESLDLRVYGYALLHLANINFKTEFKNIEAALTGLKLKKPKRKMISEGIDN